MLDYGIGRVWQEGQECRVAVQGVLGEKSSEIAGATVKRERCVWPQARQRVLQWKERKNFGS